MHLSMRAFWLCACICQTARPICLHWDGISGPKRRKPDHTCRTSTWLSKKPWNSDMIYHPAYENIGYGVLFLSWIAADGMRNKRDLDIRATKLMGGFLSGQRRSNVGGNSRFVLSDSTVCGQISSFLVLHWQGVGHWLSCEWSQSTSQDDWAYVGQVCEELARPGEVSNF